MGVVVKESIFYDRIPKQKVRDAIDKSISKWDFKYSVTNDEIQEDLLKELGLE